MKKLATLLLSVSLASAATTASSWQFSPPDTRARLRGTLTFTPNEGGHPFTCKIVFDLKTKGVITEVKNNIGICEGLEFVQPPPWKAFQVTRALEFSSFRVSLPTLEIA